MEIYRRGVASDTLSFSRPLPLCGIDQRAVCATRLGCASTGAPPWCGGHRVVQPCRARPLGAPPVGVPCAPDRHSEAPEGPWESVPLLTEKRIATSGPWPSSQ